MLFNFILTARARLGSALLTLYVAFKLRSREQNQITPRMFVIVHKMLL